MSPLISIGSAENIDYIRQKLESKFKPLLAEDIVLIIDERSLGEYNFWNLSLYNFKDDLTVSEGIVFVVKYLTAELIAETILEKTEKQLIEDLLKNYHLAFSLEEKNKILEIALKFLKESPKDKRQKTILHLILDYLETDKLLIFDGFVRFRLKKYLKELTTIVEWSVDEYLMEKEYDDFVDLLRYFVDIQDPKVEKIHVLLEKDRTFRLYDEFDNLINNDFLEGFIIEIGDNELNYEDLLISTLITIAPREVIIHISEDNRNQSILRTVEKVFKNRTSICLGCNKCVESEEQHLKRP